MVNQKGESGEAQLARTEAPRTGRQLASVRDVEAFGEWAAMLDVMLVA